MEYFTFLSPASSDSDRLQFGMWLAEYIVVFLVFVIGLRAPALEVPDYTQMENDSENVSNSCMC